MKYLVYVTEISQGQVEVRASSIDEAKEKAERLYSEGEVVFPDIDVEYTADGEVKHYHLSYACADGKVWCCDIATSKPCDEFVLDEAPSDALIVVVEQYGASVYGHVFTEEERKELKAR